MADTNLSLRISKYVNVSKERVNFHHTGCMHSINKLHFYSVFPLEKLSVPQMKLPKPQ